MSKTRKVPVQESDGLPNEIQLCEAPRAQVAAGERYSIEITDIAFGGEGVGRIDDLVVFTPFTAKGDVAEIEIVEVKKQFARARLVELKESSLLRADPQCEYYSTCGGCQYQHLQYSTQLEIKKKQVHDLMERIGKFTNPPVNDVLACPVEYGYRNRIMVRAQWNKPERRMVLGFLERGSRLVVDVENCRIASDALNADLTEARKDIPNRNGVKIMLREPAEDWIVPDHSFFQNNFHMTPVMVKEAIALLKSAGSRYLIDAYCGVGFFCIEMARAVEGYAGVELDKKAIESARLNAKNRGAENGEFVAAQTEDVLDELLKKFPAGETTVLLDPPRKGIHASCIEALRAAAPSQILYVSCHPATSARDLNALCQDGVYTLEQITPMDLFPQTQHVELIADLRLAKQV